MPVRRATPEDVPWIVELAGMLFAEDAGTRDPLADLSWPTSPEGRAHYARHVETDGSCVFVDAGATADGFLVGALRPRDPLRPGVVVADLEVLYVRPEHRSTGIGTALVDAFRSWAHAHGVDMLSVTAAATNDGAVRFYRSHGFTPHKLTLEVAPRVGRVGPTGR